MGVSQRFVDLAVGALAREKCHERRPPTCSKLGVCPPRPVAPGSCRIPLRNGRPAARTIKFPHRRDQREDGPVISAAVQQIPASKRPPSPSSTARPLCRCLAGTLARLAACPAHAE